MKQLKTEEFVIDYEPTLEDFIKETLTYATKIRKGLYKLFNCNKNDIGVLKASFFVSHKEFVDHIKTISGGCTPPDWATGCFYGGEIQVLVDIKNPLQKMNTLAHETVHLFFDKAIYEKYGIDRINWLDESFAMYLDGRASNANKNELKQIIDYIIKLADGFDMAKLADYNKLKTKDYNGYDMFIIIGKYIFENNLQHQFLKKLIEDKNKIIIKGKSILKEAIDYCNKNYNNY